MAYKIQARSDTAANWASANPILAQAELGYTTDTRVLKFGDGITAWNSLTAFASGGGGGGGGTWGSITGTLASQTDLQTALNAKAPTASPTFTGTVNGITAAMVGAPAGSGTSSGANTGDQSSIVGISGTKAQYNTSCSDANFRFDDDAITERVITLTDAATVTPVCGTTDVGILLTLSQATTFANPSGSPVDGQKLVIRVKSSTARALTFGSQYRGSADLALATTTSGSNLTDYMAFRYNSADSKWDYLAKNFGF